MKKLFVLIFIFYSTLSFAQDAQFSQFYQAPLNLNPGFAGSAGQARLNANHRIQWPGLQNAFSTYAFSYDMFFSQLRSGVGVSVMTDKIGSAGWNTTTASLIYSYKIRLTKEITFSPGLEFVYGTNGIDRSKLRMEDGLKYGSVSIDPELNKVGMQSYFDFASGFVVYTRKHWIGASFAHLVRPNMSIIEGSSRLPVKTTVHGGVKIPVSIGGPRAHTPYLTPSFVYKTQGDGFDQIDLGANFHVDPIAVGLWYSGMPFGKNPASAIDHDAMVLFFGLYLKNLTAGYSYDYTLSNIRGQADGAHEISLTYAVPYKKKSRDKFKLIPCPSFMNKGAIWNE